jgi:SPP1 gp7 family putative phage head morphogenesis protein
MPDSVVDVAIRNRRELLELDEAAARRMVAAYRQIWVAVRRDFDALTREIEAFRGDGDRVTMGRLFRLARYRDLMANAETQLRRWEGIAAGEAIGVQERALGRAPVDTLALLNASLGRPTGLSWSTIPHQAIAAMAGFTADGTPLAGLIRAANAEALLSARHSLLTGIGAGRPIAAIARQFQAAMGIPLSRSLTIVRTETLRAYREAARVGVEENAEFLEGWTWYAARDGRTCPVCWAMHGRTFPLTGSGTRRAAEVMATHPNCRCVLVPRAKSYAEITGDPSLPDNRPQVTPGPVLFSRLSPDRQAAILGPGKFARYRDGQLQLDQLVELVNDPRWGPVRREVPIARLPQQATRAGLLEQHARRIAARARAAEPATTRTLREVEKATGGRLRGLAFKLKKVGRIAEKIQVDVDQGRGTLAAVSGQINDALRYTLEFRPEAYAAGFRSTMRSLEAAGIRTVKVKNYWGGDGYQGINGVFETPSGTRFELQFHTRASLAAKDPSHKLYEDQRVLSPDSAEYRRLQREIDDMWRPIKADPPPGAVELRMPSAEAAA